MMTETQKLRTGTASNDQRGRPQRMTAERRPDASVCLRPAVDDAQGAQALAQSTAARLPASLWMPR